MPNECRVFLLTKAYIDRVATKADESDLQSVTNEITV